MNKTAKMKQAKASGDDIRHVADFFLMLEEVIEHGTYTPVNDNDEEVSEDVDAERLHELIAVMWGGPGVGLAWRRVVLGYDILVRNCCDPGSKVLEWRPDIVQALKNINAQDLLPKEDES